MRIVYTNMTKTNGDTIPKQTPIPTPTTDPGQTKTQKLYSISYGVILLCVLYAAPLGLIYYFTHYQNHTLFSGWMIFFFTLMLIYICNLLFYRVAVMNDTTAQIDKITSSTAGYVFGITLMAHFIVSFTLFVITVYPGLIEVFENTVGLWGASFWGLKRLANEIFHSPVMEVIMSSTRTFSTMDS